MQSSSQRVTVEQFMNCEAFRVGFLQVRMGQRLMPDMYRGDYQIQYELGRQFAVASGLRQLELGPGRKVSPRMIVMFESLIRDGTIRAGG